MKRLRENQSYLGYFYVSITDFLFSLFTKKISNLVKEKPSQIIAHQVKESPIQIMVVYFPFLSVSSGIHRFH